MKERQVAITTRLALELERLKTANVETAKRAAAALDMFNAEGRVQPEPAEMVN